MKDEKYLLFFHAGALGDLICTVPALMALREKGFSLIGIGNKEILELLELAQIIEKAYSMETLKFHRLFSEMKLSPELNQLLEKADVVISWIRDPQSMLEKSLKPLVKNLILFKEKFPPEDETKHIYKIYSEPCKALGINNIPYYPHISLAEEVRSISKKFVKNIEQYIVIHPGSGSKKKCYPAEKFSELIDKIENKLKLKIILIEGPADKEQIEKIKKTTNATSLIYLNDLNIVELASLLSRAKFYIGNDSGVSHLSSALGTPSLIIFGPTSPKIWAPLSERSKIIYTNYSCSPCSQKKRDLCKEQECLKTLSAEEVFEKFKSLFLQLD